jgi:hypothetical protein
MILRRAIIVYVDWMDFFQKLMAVEVVKKIHGFNGIQILYSTARSGFLPEKLTVPQLAKTFSAFYGTRRFITAFISVRHLFLS